MVPGFDDAVPYMVVMIPGTSGRNGSLQDTVTIPPGYDAEIKEGQKPDKGDYEPFFPAAILPSSEHITSQLLDRPTKHGTVLRLVTWRSLVL